MIDTGVIRFMVGKLKGLKTLGFFSLLMVSSLNFASIANAGISCTQANAPFLCSGAALGVGLPDYCSCCSTCAGGGTLSGYPPNFIFSPSSLNMGAIPQGATKSQTFTVSNSGLAESGCSVYLGSGSDPGISIPAATNNCTIPAGSLPGLGGPFECTFVVVATSPSFPTMPADFPTPETVSANLVISCIPSPAVLPVPAPSPVTTAVNSVSDPYVFMTGSTTVSFTVNNVSCSDVSSTSPFKCQTTTTMCSSPYNLSAPVVSWGASTTDISNAGTLQTCGTVNVDCPGGVPTCTPPTYYPSVITCTASCPGFGTPTPSPSPGGGSPSPSPSSTPGNPTLSANDATFGSVLLSTSATKVVTFSNGGGAATGCTLSLSATADFSFVDPGTCGSLNSLHPSCAVTVTGSPTSAGAGYGGVGDKSATLTLNCGTYSAVSHLTETEQTPPNFTFNPNSNDFNEIAIGQSQTLPVSIKNTGTLNANACSITFVPATGFSETDSCAGTVNGGSSCPTTLKATGPTGTSGTIYSTNMTIQCGGTTDPNYLTLNSVGTSGIYKFTLIICPIWGQYNSGNGCQCPLGYEVTPTTTETPSACRPILPSLEFFKSATISDGYPVCGVGRLPTATDYTIFNYANYSTQYLAPNVSATTEYTTNTAVNPPYVYHNTTAASGAYPNPNYLYSVGYTNAQRCVCSSMNLYAGSTHPPVVGDGAPLSTLLAPGGSSRFVPDTYDTIIQQTSSGGVVYGEVAIAKDNSSNAFLGNVFEAGNVACGCPNLNEVSTAIDPTQLSGSVCTSMMSTTDTPTQLYKILPTYNPLVHKPLVVSADISKGTDSVTNVQLPTQSQSYQSYKRKIWTCAPPFEQVNTGGVLTCVFKAADNVCDDGTGSGVPSAVSMNMSAGSGTGSTTQAKRFNNTVNKRLACCVNEFDPTNPTARVKFDCIDNSPSSGTTYSSFDNLWEGATSDGLSNAVALTSSSGQLMTGFYSLNGARCNEFSEFAGTITPYKVNQMLKSSQQSVVGSGTQSDIVANGTAIAQPTALTSTAGWSNYLSGKSIPQTAADMRRCPILVRAAMEATCPNAGMPPTNGNAYPSLPTPLQTYNDNGTIRCSMASQVNILLRVEQIYEITGMAKMSTIDSVTDSRQAVTLPVSDWIKSKTAGLCADGAVLMTDGSCAYQ